MASGPARARVRLTMNEGLRAQRHLPTSTVEGVIAAQTERAVLFEWAGYRQWFPKAGVRWAEIADDSAERRFAVVSRAFAEANNRFFAPLSANFRDGPESIESHPADDDARIIYDDIVKVGPGTPYFLAPPLSLSGPSPLLQRAPLLVASVPAMPHESANDVPLSKTRAWEHQRRAFWFCRGVPAAMLALDMGTGKSKVTIDLIVNRNHRRVLILCPNSVVGVWPKQFDTHAGPPLTVVPLTQDSVAAKMTRAQSYKSQPAVFVINYESAWREPFAGWALKQEWDCVIADEAHRIKQPGGKAALFVAALGRRATTRLALTGTPMPHSPLDIYAQYRFLDPSIFGTSFVRFRARYAVMGGYGNHQVIQWQNQDELHAKMYSIAFRVTKDVLDLPPVQHITRTFELSPSARKVYRELADGFESDVAAGTVTISNALVRLLRLQQITSGYVQQDDTDEWEGELVAIDDGKAALLADLLQDFAQTEPLVIFCRFQRDLDAVRTVAEEQGRRYGELSGRRKDGLAPDATMAENIDALGVQIQAGGVGIDLTRARYGVYYSLGFSLGDFEQSQARLHRPGQNRPVTYYHLQAEHTVDQKVYRALADRKDVVTAILDDIRKGKTND